MAFFLFGLVTVLGYVYRLHGRVIAEYITHYTSIRASHIEVIYEEDGLDVDRVNRAANEHIQKIGILNGSRVDVEKGFFSATSTTDIFGETFYVKKAVYNPENFMRMITVAEGIKGSLEEKGKKPDKKK